MNMLFLFEQIIAHKKFGWYKCTYFYNDGFTGTGTVVWFLQFEISNPEEYRYNGLMPYHVIIPLLVK